MASVTRFKLFSFPVVVAITALACSGYASAADQAAAAAPAAVGAAAGGAGCATCNNAGAADCATCGKSRGSIFHRTKTCKPYQTQLCPGACFGYFQTQWHRWENVCPIPYQGVGLNDAPVRPARPSTTPGAPKASGSDLPVPKTLPKIPVLPRK